MEKNIEQFRNYLTYELKPQLKPGSIDTYYYAVKSLNNWLAMRNLTMETASDSNLREWSRINTNHPAYFHGIKKYCEFLGLVRQEEIVKEIMKKLPPQAPKSTRLLINYDDFKKCFSIEKSTKKQWHAPYLHLLWSEMDKSQINRLRKCDIDFFNHTINIDGKQYYATAEAWAVLKIFVREEDREKKEKLFPRTSRWLRSPIEGYFGTRGLNAEAIKRSCKEEIMRYGRMAVFVVHDDQRLIEKLETEKIQKQVTEPVLFKQVIDEVYNFGVRMAPRMECLKDEKTLQRLLEGYLVGRFPQEIIVSEFSFQAWKDNSRIDFTLGETQIPIEVKLCTKEPIGDYIRQGFAQVKEYLNRQKLEKGIVVIGDTTRNPKHKKYCKFEDNIEIIII